MKAQPIEHPMLTEKTSVQDILNRATLLTSNTIVYDRSMVASMSNSELQKNIEALSRFFGGDRFHEPTHYGSEEERDLAVRAVIEDLHEEQVARFQGKPKASIEEQSFLISPEAQASMLKMVQERGSTSPWNGDLSAGVKLIAAANPATEA